MICRKEDCMKKTKVLHVSYGGLGKGGVSSVIFSITEHLTEQFDFGCVVFSTKGISEERFEKIGKLHRVNCYIPGSLIEKLVRPFRMYSEIKKICKNEQYDVIHCHNGEEEAFALLAAKHAGIKIRIAHSHNTKSLRKISFVKKIYCRILQNSIKKNATQKVACSAKAAIDFFETTEDVVVIPNSIDLDRYYENRNAEESHLRFVHVGRYDYSKNQEFILDVFRIIHQKNPESTLRLVGFGADEQFLKKKATDLNLNDSVSFIPGDTDVPAEYKKADYMIFPSRYEGFGIVLIEAQAAGVYCFVSESIQPEANAGFLKQLSLNDSAEIWANTILLYHAEHPRKEENRKEYYNNYKADIVSDKYGELYERSKE